MREFFKYEPLAKLCRAEPEFLTEGALSAGIGVI
jgi:hypothetical protein